MDFRKHSEWEGKHSILSASKSQWLRYTDERLFEYVDNMYASVIGTKKHALAKDLIELGVSLPNNEKTLNSYVNDCLGYRMRPEQILFYSPYAFGTADAISFRTENIKSETGEMISVKMLRIFDLKNGVKAASGEQLVVYAAYFCLEYRIRPYEIEYDLRIYQNDEINYVEVSADDVAHVMSRITDLNALITARMEEEV